MYVFFFKKSKHFSIHPLVQFFKGKLTQTKQLIDCCPMNISPQNQLVEVLHFTLKVI